MIDYSNSIFIYPSFLANNVMMQAECKSAANSLSDFQTLCDRPNLFKSDNPFA